MSDKAMNAKAKNVGKIWESKGMYFLKLILGPAVFFMLLNMPIQGLERNAMVSLAVYGWLIVWWVIKPIPWIATALVPLLLFPVLEVMNLKTVVTKLFGQRIMFLLIFVFLLAKAIRRYGLGERLSLTLLSVKWINGSIDRFIGMYMVATALMQAIFGIVGIIVGIPIGVAVIDHIYKETELQGIEFDKKKLGSHVILACAYGQLAGGMMTIQAIPQNALVLSLFEEQTGVQVSFFQWLIPGIITGVVFLAVAYLALKVMFKYDLKEIPGGQEYFENQRNALGKLSKSEKRLALVVGIIVFLWSMQTFVKITGFDFYWISFLGLFLLYVIPSGDDSGDNFITEKDAKTLNWDVIFLVTAAVGFSGLMTEFGVIGYIAGQMSGLNGLALVVIAAIVTPLMTNFLAGMATAATMSTLLIPLLLQTSIHPLVGVKLIAIGAVGLMFPWAGTAGAITFGSQRIDFKHMAYAGFVMAILLAGVMIPLNLLLSKIPFFFPPM